MAKMVEREEKRKAKRLAKLRDKEANEINSKLAQEQKKLLKTQRKLQAIRLIEELFKRIQIKHKHNKNDLYGSRTQSSMHYDNKYELKKLQTALLQDTEQMSSRERLMSRYISAQERELEHQREKITKAMNGKLVLRSALEMKKPRPRTSSISSISSEESFYEASARKIKTEKMSAADDHMAAGQAYPPMMQNYNNYQYPYNNAPYPYQQPPSHPGGFYPGAPMYPHAAMAKAIGGFIPRGRGFQRRQRGTPYARGSFRGATKMPYFNGPNANHEYYMYFKRLAEGRAGEHDDRSRSRSRSRRRSYSDSRSRSRSRSRNRHRRHSRSRSRSRGRSRSRSRYSRSRSRSRNRRSRSRSRRSRSGNRRSRSRSRSRNYSKSKRSRSRARSHSHSQTGKSRQSKEKSADRSRRSQSKDRNSDRKKSNSPVNRKESDGTVDDSKTPVAVRPRSRSWSLPKESDKGRRSWSKSPVNDSKKNDT